MDVTGWIAFNVMAFIILAPWIEKKGPLGLVVFFILAFGITFLAKVVLPRLKRRRCVSK